MLEISKEELIAYSQINNILNHIEKEYYQKVPVYLINFFKNNALDYGLYYDDKGDLKISKLTELILCYINLEYWSTEEEKQELIKQYIKNQKENDKQYDISKIFESKKAKKYSQNTNKLILNENWFQKIIRKIKKVFE